MITFRESIAAFPVKKNDRPFKKGDRVIWMVPGAGWYKLCTVLTSSNRGCKIGDDHIHSEDTRRLFGQLSGTEIRDGWGSRSYIIHRPEPLNVEWLKATLIKQRGIQVSRELIEWKKMLYWGEDTSRGNLPFTKEAMIEQIKLLEASLHEPVGEYWEKIRNYKFSWNKD